MSEKTQQNLVYAFAAESKASARNMAFALKAEQDGYPRLARLFRAVSDAESVHARRYLLSMRGKIGSTQENLETAYLSEKKASTEEYPRLIKDADEEGFRQVKKAFSHSRDADAEHARLFEKAMRDKLEKSETEYYVCQICGYISEDHVPKNCPVCHAVKGRFKLVM
jgi:rubrerythrin